ncbi:hypothetical protein FPZ24_13085 [Sphingomonas panacisoli]|uniref:Uncharacterized protein n=1 Tax=Sphingomonas panacisoli TaxID=1813879 RepID=A0A5B8LJW9_9SPHN|nr:hypothetical protein [Sphingomonas panacisoli]QDZ08296.1 hypothetical protein FPZ24_13085 [Sphingomonas panacisoli]
MDKSAHMAGRFKTSGVSTARGSDAPSFGRTRLAHLEMRALVGSAIDDVHSLATHRADEGEIEARLVSLDRHTTGRKSPSCRVLAAQIHLWYATYDGDRARALSREAIVQHSTATIFGRTSSRFAHAAPSTVPISSRSH